jgi:hypothetical protein
MDYSLILKRSWSYMWRYRALWLFGALLALTTVSGLYFIPGDTSQGSSGDGLTIQLTEDNQITFPGDSFKVEYDDQDGATFLVKDNGRWEELHDVWEYFPKEIPDGILAILVVLIVEVVVIALIATMLRYVSEAALIQMVNTAEKTGERLGIRDGFKLGWSRTAWRLFLIDLLVYLPVVLLFILLFGLAFSPLALWTSGNTAAGVAGTVVSIGMLVVVISLAVVVGIVLSPVLMVFRRACAIEQISPFASIGRGFRVVRSQPLEVFITWLIWMGVRIVAMVALMPLLLVLLPLVLAAIVLGALIGALPLIVVGGISSLFFAGPIPWILGAMVAFPIFIVVMISPFLFAGGLVEVYKSSMWTLAYRQLRDLADEKLNQVTKVAATV